MDPTASNETRLARLAVSTSAIVENWRFFDRLSGNAECAAVVKADAYGLGAREAARALASIGARTFFTATLGEALAISAEIAGARVYVLNGPGTEDHLSAFGETIRPILNSLEQIARWNARGPAALHVDTGMNRLGLNLSDVSEAARTMGALKPDFVMSHLACAPNRAHPMNAAQRARFIEAASAFPGARLSLSATGGALIGADYHFDMIRPGIGLYGSGDMEEDNPVLAPVARLTAPILQLRDVAAGETFGYGATARAEKAMRAATVAVGYADGFLRSFAGRGYGMIGGAKLPLLGRVSMDLLILDATAAPNAREGDDIEFLGANARLDDVAAAAGTTPYEILTTLAGSVRRA
ncbi:MAG: alanine racemase [Hyphomonadaceae bacterium]